jgi:hypothetical protein
LNAAQALLALAMATPLVTIARELAGAMALTGEMRFRLFGLPAALTLLGLSNALVGLGLWKLWPAARRGQILLSFAWLPAIPYGLLAGILSLVCVLTPGVKLLFSRRARLSNDEKAIVAVLEARKGALRLVYVAVVTLAVLGVVFALNLLGGVIRHLAR